MNIVIHIMQNIIKRLKNVYCIVKLIEQVFE